MGFMQVEECLWFVWQCSWYGFVVLWCLVWFFWSLGIYWWREVWNLQEDCLIGYVCYCGLIIFVFVLRYGCFFCVVYVG